MNRKVLHGSSAVPSWVQLLAAAVVQQALCDACDTSLPRGVRDEARQFLSGSSGYRFWCCMSEGRSPNGGHRANGHAFPAAIIANAPAAAPVTSM